MKKEEKLKAIIDKAIKNGFKNKELLKWFSILEDYHYDEYIFSQYPMLIFSHDFLKAFFGEEKHYFPRVNYEDRPYGTENCKCGAYSLDSNDYCWQFHAQQLILQEEPIDYLHQHS